MHKMTHSARRKKYKRKSNVGQKAFLSHWEDFARPKMIQGKTEGPRSKSRGVISVRAEGLREL